MSEEQLYTGRAIGKIVDFAAGAVGDLAVQIEAKLDKTDPRVPVYVDSLKSFLIGSVE